MSAAGVALAAVTALAIWSASFSPGAGSEVLGVSFRLLLFALAVVLAGLTYAVEHMHVKSGEKSRKA